MAGFKDSGVRRLTEPIDDFRASFGRIISPRIRNENLRRAFGRKLW